MPLSRVGHAWATARLLRAIPCPGCGAREGEVCLRYDRYFLRVDITVCRVCGLVHTGRNLAGDSLIDFYRTRYRAFYQNIERIDDDYVARQHARPAAAYRFDRIRQVTGPLDGVVEIGSGLGYFLEECRGHGVGDLLGFEPETLFQRYAAETLGLGARVLAASPETVGALPFVPRLVAGFHVLEHLADPHAVLGWIRRQLHPEGWLVLEVPDIDGDWRQLGVNNFHLLHRCYFSAATLSNLLGDCGFATEFVTRDRTDGLYPGNLRIFARPTDQPQIRLPVDPAATARAIRGKIHALSIRNGYPRTFVRFLR